MNTAHELTYLSGGDAYFGPDFGGAQVCTLARTGWAADCPNAAQFFKNLVFTVDMENQMMGLILDDGESGPDAAVAWIKENPDALGPWLDGVTTFAGRARPAGGAGRARPLTRPAMTRPNVLVLMVDQLAGTFFPDGPAPFLHAPNLRALAARSRPLRQRLRREPALRPLARLLHVRPPAQPHPRLRQRRRVRLRHPDLRPPPAPRRLRRPASRARCTSSAPTSCTASRSG